jgi:D-glycero-alpha-D-manno-heptose-7-phosphate kinase
MIIARSPLRITLGGGGTDLPSYYRDHEGFLIAAAIDKYVYVTVMRPFTEGVYLKYSQLEHVSSVEEVKHRIIREALRMQDLRTPQIEITTLADIPAGTGLGSSGSFTTALLKAIYAHRRQLILPQELAELACHIEIDRLGEPIGKQDQFAAAFGGLTCYTFHRDNTVTAVPLKISMDTLFDLDDEMLKNLHFVKELGFRSKEALEAADLTKFGQLMNEQWELKKGRSSGMSNPRIDEWYQLAMDNGAVGGKLVGAGGGGFLMFYAADRDKLRHAMSKAGLEEVRFGFDFDGTKVVLS